MTIWKRSIVSQINAVLIVWAPVFTNSHMRICLLFDLTLVVTYSVLMIYVLQCLTVHLQAHVSSQGSGVRLL